MKWGKVILVEVYERILRCWLYGRSIWMNFALLNAFNRYCVTLTGMLRKKCSVMILIWIHRWLFRWFRLWYQKFWWVFLYSGQNMLTPGDPCLCVSVCLCVCVCLSVCLCVCHSLSFPQILADADENFNWSNFVFFYHSVNHRNHRYYQKYIQLHSFFFKEHFF